MRIFMNGGRSVELSEAELLRRAKSLILEVLKTGSYGRNRSLMTKESSDGCTEFFYIPEGLGGIGCLDTAKEIAALFRKKIGCRAWVYKTYSEISGDYCSVCIGPFEKVDWGRPSGQRVVHRYTREEVMPKLYSKKH